MNFKDFYNSKEFIKSEFQDFDMMTGGFQKGTLTVIAGRPSIGKTSLITSICSSIMSKTLITYFSFSEKKSSIIEKIVRQMSQVDFNCYNDQLSPDEFQFVVEAIKTYEQSKMKVIDNFFTINDVENEITKNEVDLVIVDDFQNIQERNCQLVAYEIMKKNNELLCYLKKLAREKNVAIVLLSSISRKVEERCGHRPCLLDFNDCEMENYPDLICFLHRREYYDFCDRPGQAELIISKNKRGITGTCNLTFCQDCSLFQTFMPYNQQ